MAEKKSESEATNKKTTAKSAEVKKSSAEKKPTANKTAAKKATETNKTQTPAAKNPAKTETKPVAEKPKKAEKAQPVKAENKPSATAKAQAKDIKSAAKTQSENKAVKEKAQENQAVKATAQEKQAEPKPKARAAKTEKPAKAEKSVKAEKSGNSGGVAALLKNTKIRIIAIVTAAVLLLGIILGSVLGAKACNESRGPHLSNEPPQILTSEKVSNDNPLTLAKKSDKPVIAPSETVEGEKREFDYLATSAVGFSAKILGTVERLKPIAETKDERNAFPLEGIEIPEDGVRYPKYGYTMNSVIGDSDEKKAARAALIDESDYLTAYGTRNNSGNGNNGDASYTWMDENGYLYSGSTANPVKAVDKDGAHRRLYKHSAAEGMYYGGFNDANPELSDEEPAVIKQVTIRPRGYGSYSVTGLYAPAGEVIKIQISEEDMNATGGITIHIGQALYNGQSNNIWVAKGQMQRFPNILNTMNVNKDTATLKNGVYTAYVGSFIGGPIYIRNTVAEFTATISGGVKYSHFILGYTTKEEFEENKNTSTPYFDLEVWNYGVLHSGPKYFAQSFSYEDLYKAAVLWEKVASVTTTGSSQGIVFLYDPFVAAGAAVAFPGRSSVNCPAGWMGGSLNYNAIVSSGSWGNFHEYHHNFQGYGVGNGGEVTNNGMTLVSYALFTKISSKRGISAYGGQGLGGWNNYTSATWALNDILSLSRGGHPSNGDQGLALYATLLHNFGANNYVQAKYTQQHGGYGQSYAGYMRAWEETTHNDMSYYFTDVLKGLSSSEAAKTHNSEYGSVFVPVSSVYQTGRSYTYDGGKKYFQTMQPYVIPYGTDFNVDLSRYTAPNGQYESGSIVIPDNFVYRIKSITQPEHGKIEVVDNYNFKFTPDTNKYSGQIIVTLEIAEKKNSFTVDDVDLVLEFEQSHETNKMTLERTTYTYNANTMYTDAQTAYENGFKNYSSIVENADHTNPVQNCNTDIWFYPDNEQARKEHPDSPESHFVHPNTIEVLDGKLYFEEEGTYRIYLRGRTNCAVYYSTDGGKTYTLGAKVTNGSGAGFYTNNPETYFDVELAEHSWVYVKEVLIVQSTPVVSYIGLGYGKWTTPLITMTEKELADGTVQTIYTYNGKEYTEAELAALNLPDLTPPTSASYINAYRRSYEFPDNTGFESDYFYRRNYSYSYVGTPEVVTEGKTQTPTPECNYKGWDPAMHDVQNLFDGKSDTGIHFSSDWGVSENKPAVLAFDVGEEITANTLTLYTYLLNNQGAKAFPQNFTLQGSIDGKTYFNMGTWTNQSVGSAKYKDFELSDTFTFRYYKLTVTASQNGRCALNGLSFTNILRFGGGIQITPDDEAFTYVGNWQIKQAQSTFGHVYAGEANATMSFKFNGTRLAVLSSEAFGDDFEVTIDGKKMTSVELKAVTGGYGATFISDLLENKEHNVTIKCIGKANVESIVIYQ